MHGVLGVKLHSALSKYRVLDQGIEILSYMVPCTHKSKVTSKLYHIPFLEVLN